MVLRSHPPPCPLTDPGRGVVEPRGWARGGDAGTCTCLVHRPLQTRAIPIGTGFFPERLPLEDFSKSKGQSMVSPGVEPSGQLIGRKAQCWTFWMVLGWRKSLSPRSRPGFAKRGHFSCHFIRGFFLECAGTGTVLTLKDRPGPHGPTHPTPTDTARRRLTGPVAPILRPANRWSTSGTTSTATCSSAAPARSPPPRPPPPAAAGT